VDKTTVYLPEDLKRSLSRVAAMSGVSEAQVIREAIADKVRSAAQPRPRGKLFASGEGSLSESVDDALAGFGER
jgi:hypothetical protein